MSTFELLLAVSVCFVSALALVSFVCYRLLRPAAVVTTSTPVRLAPMERLLANSDFEFLAGEPGFQPSMLAELRKSRVEIFSSYLNLVTTEFHHLHRQLRILTLQAGIDSPEISKALVQQRVLFSIRMLQVQYRLFFFRFGMAPVNVKGIASVVEQMREQVAQLSLSAAPGMVAA